MGQFRNFPMVPRVVYGPGCIDQLDSILMPKRRNTEAPFIYLVDAVFEDKPLLGKLPLRFEDRLIFIDTTEEPKTEQVDRLVALLQDNFEEIPSGIIGLGGGSILDLAKAVALLMTNPGSAADYQGWDLVKRPGLYHVGIPTISGTGAEVSRTAVLMGPEKKLGLNSDHTPFDQVVLDPELTEGVPNHQWFYTGMDCYIHCVESLNGTYLNAFSQSYGEKAMELCKEVFLNGERDLASREKLMMASWHGGMSIAYSQVGVAHALSYGLSFLLGVRHGIGNCLVFRHLSDFYPEGVALFHEMCEKHKIVLPKDICSQVDDAGMQTMVKVALSLEPLWENALGADWKKQVSPELIEGLYRKI
ncbi:iron-containing alcohol dehydrogenase family protein [Sediminicola luteus]|nr:iron-containing alcohol dehydrogenase family protein [Sediminicola luteus]